MRPFDAAQIALSLFGLTGLGNKLSEDIISVSNLLAACRRKLSISVS